MRVLPSRGRCHAVFLLAYSARVRHCEHVDAWLAAAFDKPTHMAASLDLAGTAHFLQECGLAKVSNGVVLGRELTQLDRVADLTTLKAIARLLLTHRPPIWLRTAVINDRLATEFIPVGDLEALLWLGSDLEPIIVGVHRYLYGANDDELLKGLGDAGELMVMSALRALGRRARHVALVSDRFGYDIELDEPGMVLGLEVKTAVPSTSSRILLSRHEFDVAQRMGNCWKIVQVTLSSQVIARGMATTDDVLQLRELTSDALTLMLPPDVETFRWTEGAEFKPPPEMWQATDLTVPAGFTFKLIKDWHHDYRR